MDIKFSRRIFNLNDRDLSDEGTEARTMIRVELSEQAFLEMTDRIKKDRKGNIAEYMEDCIMENLVIDKWEGLYEATYCHLGEFYEKDNTRVNFHIEISDTVFDELNKRVKSMGGNWTTYIENCITKNLAIRRWEDTHEVRKSGLGEAYDEDEETILFTISIPESIYDKLTMRVVDDKSNLSRYVEDCLRERLDMRAWKDNYEGKHSNLGMFCKRNSNMILITLEISHSVYEAVEDLLEDEAEDVWLQDFICECIIEQLILQRWEDAQEAICCELW